MCNPSQGFYGDNCREPLTPAAQAVLNAAARRYAIDGDLQDSIAAALRAAAKQSDFADLAVNKTVEVVLVEHLLALAAELENLSE